PTLPSLFRPLSLHDALPISNGCWQPDSSSGRLLPPRRGSSAASLFCSPHASFSEPANRSCTLLIPRSSPAISRKISAVLPIPLSDRKSTRLNSSHLGISYAV